MIHRHTPPCVALVPCFLSKKIHPEDNYFKADREHWKPNIFLRSAGFLYFTGGSYIEAKMHGKWRELLHPVGRQGPNIHLSSPGQPFFGPPRTHPVGEVITLISTQLFLLYAGQDHQAARKASLPNSSSNPKILTIKTFKVGIQRIGLVSLLPHLCRKIKLCQPGRAKGDRAVSSSMC